MLPSETCHRVDGKETESRWLMLRHVARGLRHVSSQHLKALLNHRHDSECITLPGKRTPGITPGTADESTYLRLITVQLLAFR
jgi:hypothetical protein